MNSFLRWAGSKRQLIHALRAYWKPSYRRYIEPFCGSACLFFDLEPAESVLGDLNEELITTYRAIRFSPSLVLEALRRFPISKLAYYRIRQIDASKLTDTQRAARFLYLNRLCFNGIFRTNQKGHFNVPYAPPKGKWSFNETALYRASDLLRNTVLLTSDFATTLSCVKRDDFVYIDPPYAVERRRIFSEYHPHSFNSHDLERLQKALFSIEEKGATFLISYADSREARTLLRPWITRRIWTRRNIAGFASDRRGAYELMATNARGHSK